MTGATALIPTVRLFARLLLHELDRGLLAELSLPPVAAALRDVGVELPGEVELEPLHARYVELFLHPERGAPPVASLWIDGQYDGDSAVALRKVAAAAGREFERAAAGEAPVDHLGCVLLLWCACAEPRPELAELIAHDYLAWADRALAWPSQGNDFYGQVCRAARALVATLRTDGGRPAETPDR